MSVNEDEIRNLIDLHNAMLEAESERDFPYREIAIKRAKSFSPSLIEVISGKIRKLAIIYFSLALIFVFISLAIINMAEKRRENIFVKKLNVELFRSDYKGGLVYAFNKVLE